MSNLVSIATGNFTSSSTWGVADTTSYMNAVTGAEVLTTAYSGTRSSAFAPGAITISHIAVRLAARTGTTGTISVSLNNSTIGADDFVMGTEVTIDTADLPVAATADINGGWILFKLASPVLLLAATNYKIQAKTSTAAMVSLFRDATADNLARVLVTTTTAAPAAGDNMIIAGEMTGQGTSNAFTVTMDNTATTDFGSAPTAANSLIMPGISISAKGTLTWGTTAATAYYLKLSNSFTINSGGVANVGTTGTKIPRDSSATLLFDCGANVDYGLLVRNLGTLNVQGLSRTVSKNIYTCKLNTDEAAAQTVLGVDTDTGWLSGDVIAIASTSRTGAESEDATLASNATSTTLTASSGIANAHSGTSPTQAEVILLTRNIIIQGASATLQAYINILATATVDIDWCEFKWLGSATATKRGIECNTTTGSAAFSYCAIHDFVVTSSIGLYMSGSTTANITIEYCVFNKINTTAILRSATSGAGHNINNAIVIGTTAGQPVNVSNCGGGTLTNITVAGNATTSNAISLTGANGAFGVDPSGLVAHSNGGIGIQLLNINSLSSTSLASWRNNAVGVSLSGLADCVVAGLTLFGNLTTNCSIANLINTTISDGVIASDTTFTTTNGITFTGGAGNLTFVNSTFGIASGIFAAHTRDILPTISSLQNMIFDNCLFSSSVEVSGQTTMPPGVTYRYQKHDQTSGDNRTLVREGTITLDTTSGMFDVTPSIRITPTLAAEVCKVVIGRVNLNSGQTATPSVKVRESVVGDGTDYNGNRVKLYVSRNHAMGITADALLDTATVTSEGAFETLTGTSAAASEDGVMEFYVTCDGTTGWINVDTLTVVVA